MKKPSSSLLLTGRIVFFLALALCLFFVFYGISPLVDSFIQGYIHVQMVADTTGQWVLDPESGREAAKAGVEKGDILLSVNGQTIPAGIQDPAELLRGKVGEPVTISVQKADGSEKTYTIVLSGIYQQNLANAGLKPVILVWYYLVLYLLVGLAFTTLATMLILRHNAEWLTILGSFLLLFFPYSLNLASIAYNGALQANLYWLYNLERAAGLFLTIWLLLVFPNGKFTPKWTRWALIAVAVWMVPYYIDVIGVRFIPGIMLDIIWIIILALGIGVQAYRTLRVSTQEERTVAKPVMQAALVALIVYVLIWVVSRFVIITFSNPIQIWFSILSELLVDAALLFFGFRLARAIQKAK